MDWKGIIFDMDGTLLDSMIYWRRIGSICLKYFGKEPREADFDRRIYRMSNEQIIRIFAEYGMTFQNRQDYVNTYYAAIKPYYEKVKPLDGVPEFLKKMQEKGERMCVATATRSDVAIPVLERLDLMKYFEFLLCCDDVGAGKDKPDIYLRAAEKLGYPVAETLVMEDALYCVRTAKHAGFPVIGVMDRTADPEEIAGMRKESDRFIESYAEILEDLK
ncbi:MAG: HAD family hydrolase [Candidatus Merdivicinus sp.]|jgi:HAD superfamily hydrolase (TIGR01509 family)